MFTLEFPPSDDDEIVLDLTKIYNATHVPSSIRLLANEMMNRSYMRIGDWFRNLNESDLDELLNIIDLEDSDDAENRMAAAEILLLLTMMLRRAEGLEIRHNEEMLQSHSALKTILAGCSLYRQGLIDMMFDNISLGEDSYDKPIMKRKK